MSHEIDLKKYSIRTDLIVESIKDLPDKTGINWTIDNYDEIMVEDVIIDKIGSKNSNKKEGRYITISFQDITDSKNREDVSNIFIKEMRKLLEYCHITKDDDCFIVGLGNRSSTPDALGPKTIENILVTRHLFELGTSVEKGYRNVCVLNPGVSGTTGIETSEIILGIVKNIKPKFLIVVDALASSKIDRVNKTIQITNTGIAPGSGVGNTRRELSEEKLGIPVIAIGIPTVVDVTTIVSDTIHYMFKQFSYNKENYNKSSHKLSTTYSRNYLEHDENLSPDEKEKILGMVGKLSDDEIRSLIFEVLTPIGYNLMVTPKEIDFVIDKLSLLLSKGLNRTLHDKLMTNDDI